MDMITYQLDDEPQTTNDKTLTPRQILTNGGIEVATHYLVLLHGNSGERDALVYILPVDVREVLHPYLQRRSAGAEFGTDKKFRGCRRISPPPIASSVESLPASVGPAPAIDDRTGRNNFPERDLWVGRPSNPGCS